MTKKLTKTQRRKYRTRNKLKRVNIRQNPNRDVRPRLTVHRTNKQIYAQIIDDRQEKTLVSASSLDNDLKLKNGGTVDAAKKVGELAAKRAKKAGIKHVQFDRGSFIYHGRIKALAEGARDGGLEF